MKGAIFAFMGGAFLTLQSVANSRISQDIGTWHTATITQFTGFLTSLMVLLIVGEKIWHGLKRVQPAYLTGGAFAAMIIFSNVTAMHLIGATLTISVLLIAQLSMTFFMDCNGWFGLAKQKMRLPQFIGIGLMIAGVVILKM